MGSVRAYKADQHRFPEPPSLDDPGIATTQSSEFEHDSDTHVIHRRSRQGCLTCKLRKKRCDEVKPICGDCRRLNRRCEYITSDMTPEQVRKLKKEMALIESESKTRHRKKKVAGTKPKVNPKKSVSGDKQGATMQSKTPEKKPVDDKVIFNPLSMDFFGTPSNWIQRTDVIDFLQRSETLLKPEQTDDSHLSSQPSPQQPFDPTTQLSEIFSPGFSRILQERLQESPEEPKISSLSPIRSPTALDGFDWPHVDKTETENFAEHSNEKEADQQPQQQQPQQQQQLETFAQQTQQHQLLRPGKSYYSMIYMNPSIVTSTQLANLTPVGKMLYEYYRDIVCSAACTAPREENMYLHTFLPMAHIDKSVLYGILAWSAFHLGGTKMVKQGNYYVQKAIQGFSKRPVVDEDTIEYYKDVTSEYDINDEDIVKEDPSAMDASDQLTLSMLTKDDMISMRLAAFLILCATEICRGDVFKWSHYLKYGARLIKLKGGLPCFNNSKDEHFLATNYAYHDITAMAHSRASNLHFDLSEYEQMWTASSELGFLDPLHNISAPVFAILARINTLSQRCRRVYKQVRKARSITLDDSDDEQFLANAAEELQSATSDYTASGGSADDVYSIGSLKEAEEEAKAEARAQLEDEEYSDDEYAGNKYDEDDDYLLYERYEDIVKESQLLERELNDARPKEPTLMNLKPSDLELQLTVFECFQLTAKIHLRQAVLHMAPSALEIQFLLNQLVKSLDVLLGTDVEGGLCFPMFIAGMNSVYQRDRHDMSKRYREFIKRYRWKNVLRCQIVTKHLWKINPLGDKYVDWYEVVERMGWELSFA